MLTKRQKFYYAICRFGSTILLNMVFVATFWMYNNEVGLDPILNGIGNAVGKLVIGISSVVFGYISDSLSSSTSKLGRRKIFIWTGAPILAVSFLMLFTPQFFIPENSEGWKFAWLLIWNATFHLFYGYLLIPYQSWMPEITTENERVEVSAYQNTVNLIGSAVGSGFIIVMSGFITDSPQSILLSGFISSNPQFITQSIFGSSAPQGIYGPTGTYLFVFALAFAIIEIVVFLPALFKIKEKPIINNEKRKIFEEIKVALKNRNYTIWIISFTVLNIGVTIMTALLIDFLEQIVGVESALPKTIFGGVMFLIVFLSFVFWSRFSKRFGKKWSLILSFSFLLIWMPTTPLVGIVPGIPPIIQGYLFSGVAMFGIASAYLFPYAILADFADADERITKENRSGLYTGFKSLPFNIAQAVGFLLAGVIRKWPDGLKWLGPIVTIFLVIAIPIIWQGDFDPFLKDESVKKTSIFKQIFNKKD